LGKRENKIFDLFCFVLILNVFRAENLFCFSLGKVFVSLLPFKIADLFICQWYISLIKTHFVFLSFGFTKPLWQCESQKSNSSFSGLKTFYKNIKPNNSNDLYLYEGDNGVLLRFVEVRMCHQHNNSPASMHLHIEMDSSVLADLLKIH
jgi:hypothetical protein